MHDYRNTCRDLKDRWLNQQYMARLDSTWYFIAGILFALTKEKTLPPPRKGYNRLPLFYKPPSIDSFYQSFVIESSRDFSADDSFNRSFASCCNSARCADVFFDCSFNSRLFSIRCSNVGLSAPFMFVCLSSITNAFGEEWLSGRTQQE